LLSLVNYPFSLPKSRLPDLRLEFRITLLADSDRAKNTLVFLPGFISWLEKLEQVNVRTK
jgi:hypothetical protein